MYDEDDMRVLSAIKRQGKQTKSLLNKRSLDPSEMSELEEWFLSE